MFRFLPLSHSFSKGADLWILSEPQHSSLAKKIDWHLQFIFEKSNKSPQDPLLIESSLYLPNTHTLFIPKQTNWLTQALESWSRLEKPSLRLFLPCFLSKNDLNFWPNEKLPYLIHIVHDPITTK